MTAKNFVLYRVVTINARAVHCYFKYGSDGILNGTTDYLSAATRFTMAGARREYLRMRARAIRQGHSIGYRQVD